jgi:uncharacterized protein with PIN domain
MKSLRRFISLPLYRYIYAIIRDLILAFEHRNDPVSPPIVCQICCPHCRHELTRHEIGILNAAVGRTRSSTSHRYWQAKLTTQDAELVRQSKEPTRQLAEKYNVSFQTIWQIKKGLTYNSQNELNCPHCRNELTPKEISRIFATLGTSIPSPRKVKAAVLNARKKSKLTEEMLQISENQALRGRNLQGNTKFIARQ